MRKAACLVWILSLVLAMARPGLAQKIQISVGSDDCSGTLPGPFPCLGGTYVDSGTTASANNTVGQVNAGCFQRTAVPAPDVIYSFVSSLAFGDPTLDIRVAPEPGYDVAIYLVGPGSVATACPVGPNATIANCATGADAGGPGVTEIISHAALLGLAPGQLYYLIIDSGATGPSSSGSYTLSIGPSVCPVELMDFSVE
jgi:hypothetical protein